MNLKLFKKCIPFILIIMTITNYQSFTTITVHANEKKIIYLTFDDGPAGKVTKDILDILKNRFCSCNIFSNWKPN